MGAEEDDIHIRATREYQRKKRKSRTTRGFKGRTVRRASTEEGHIKNQ
jgi:hypothetical protein